MANFTVLVLKIAFLVILWLFIVVIAVIIHSDMAGRRQKKSKHPADGAATPENTPKKNKKNKKEPWVLAIDSGIHAGDRLQLVPQVRIGRSDGCELVLDDDYISQNHAVLNHHDNGTWVLTDLGSTNGTYVNAERISAPTVVGTDDIIRVGGVQMRLEL